MDHGEVSPYADDGTLITPLTTGEFAAPLGSGDKLVQAYNFRLCTTENRSNKVPWPKPANYNRSDWELLFKYLLWEILVKQSAQKSLFRIYSPYRHANCIIIAHFPIESHPEQGQFAENRP